MNEDSMDRMYEYWHGNVFLAPASLTLVSVLNAVGT